MRSSFKPRRKTSATRAARKATATLNSGLRLALGFASLATTTLKAMAPPAPKRPAAAKHTARKVRKTAGATAQRSSFRAGTFVCEHGSRQYKLFIPGRTPDAKPAPLLVMLHGCGQTPDDFAKGTRMNALAKEFGFLVLYPAQSRDVHPNRCWNWFDRRDQARDAGEAALLASLTRQIVQQQGADPGRVYVAGLSAGGSAALILATIYPEIFAAVGVHSGLPAGAAQDQASAMVAMQRGNPGWRHPHPKPTIIFHGSHDRVVNPRNGRLAAIRAREPYASLRAIETQGQIPNGRAYAKSAYRIGAGRPLVEHWSITAAGHAWSGGSPTGRFTDPKGPDASREMIRFFRRHSLPARQRAALSARIAKAAE